MFSSSSRASGRSSARSNAATTSRSRASASSCASWSKSQDATYRRASPPTQSKCLGAGLERPQTSNVAQRAAAARTTAPPARRRPVRTTGSCFRPSSRAGVSYAWAETTGSRRKEQRLVNSWSTALPSIEGCPWHEKPSVESPAKPGPAPPWARPAWSEREPGSCTVAR